MCFSSPSKSSSDITLWKQSYLLFLIHFQSCLWNDTRKAGTSLHFRQELPHRPGFCMNCSEWKMDSLRAKRKPSLWVANIKTKLACAVSMGDQTNPRNRKACHWTCNSVSVGNEDSVHDHLLLMFSVGVFLCQMLALLKTVFHAVICFVGVFCYWLLLSWCGVCFGGVHLSRVFLLLATAPFESKHSCLQQCHTVQSLTWLLSILSVCVQEVNRADGISMLIRQHMCVVHYLYTSLCEEGHACWESQVWYKQSN